MRPAPPIPARVAPSPARRLLRRLNALGRSASTAIRPLRRAASRALARPGPGAQVHVSWSEDPRHSLTVTWTTPAGRGPAQVEVGPASRADVVRVPAESAPSPGARGTLHRAVVRGLAADTEYVYRVSGDRGAAEPFGAWHRVRTAPGGARARARALFIGDTGIAGRADGTTGAHAELLRALVDEAPHVVLGGGDYAYANHDTRFGDHADAIDAWFEEFEPLLACAPFMAQFGNHDVELGERFEDWAPRLSHPKHDADGRSYSFDLGAAHIVGLWAPGRAPREQDLRWLADDLASDSARKARWRIVFQHAPLYSSGSSHPARPEVAALLDRFDALGVDLHLSAHDQNYERTHPLRGGRAAAPRGRDGVVTRYDAGAGVICAKISPTGKLSERGGDFSRFDAPPAPVVAARDDTRHHWGVLEVSHDELALRVEGLSPDGRTRSLVEQVVVSRA